VAREYATRARAAGHTWEEIAVAAQLEPTAEPWERAAAAFTLAAGPPARVWDTQVVRWLCGSCRQRIRDTGPYAGRGDEETGHTPTCERRLAQLAVWEAQDAAADLDDEGWWDGGLDDTGGHDEDFDDDQDEDVDEDLYDDGDRFPKSDWNPDAPQGFR
jgi:hypothetical protein